jgi:predicted naringenin-chalcone synthase
MRLHPWYDSSAPRQEWERSQEGIVMGFSILGLGTAVPEHRMTQDQSALLARRVICQSEKQARVLTALYQKAGVHNRYTALPHEIALNWAPEAGSDSTTLATGVNVGPTTGERMQYFAQHASALARQAAQGAIAAANVEPRRISHLITVSCTGFSAPGVDIDLIHDLELRPTTQRIQVGFMGCHGAINGLRCGRALTLADPAAVVLLCAVELCSLHYRFDWDPPRMVANALFGDGAAAIVGAGSSVGNANEWSVAGTASCVLPDSKDAMTWRIGEHGFEMTLAATVPDLIRTHLRNWLSAWLLEHGHSIESVRSWAIHPGGPRILNECAEALALSPEHIAVSQEVLAEFGNMSSPTVIFIVKRLRERKAPRPCVSLAFGPGLTAEAVLFH